MIKNISNRKKHTTTTNHQSDLLLVIDQDPESSESTLEDAVVWEANKPVPSAQVVVELLVRTSDHHKQQFSTKDETKEKKKKKKKSQRKKGSSNNNRCRKKNEKNVSFQMDSNGQIETTIEEYERCSRPQNVWWNKEEMKSFRQNAIDTVKGMQTNSDYTWALGVLYQNQRANNSSKDKQEETLKEIEEDEDYESILNQALDVLSQHSTLRGLETHIHPHVAVWISNHKERVLQRAEGGSTASTLRMVSRHGDDDDENDDGPASKVFGLVASRLAALDTQEAAVAYAC